jgi:hypothetical protein
MDVNDGHQEKKEFPMEVIHVEILMDESDEHIEKKEFSLEVIEI